MIRQGVLCLAGLAKAAAPFAIIRSRAILPRAQRTGAYLLQKKTSPFRGIACTPRLHNSEASAAPIKDSETAAGQDITKFVDLAQLGVQRNLLDAITNDFRYESMTPVQAKTITPALKGTDIVAQAKTGTGKTLAFLLPMLQRMIQEDPSLAARRASRNARSDDIRGIVLSPTRELAEQIAVEARRLVRRTGLVVQSAVGGTQKREMLRRVQYEGCHLLVATPGRLMDLLSDTSSGIDAPNLAALVLDEADRMLDVGFEKELQDILRCLPTPEEKVRQTMLVSATIPENVIQLARSMVRHDNFEFVQTIPENESLTHDHVPQHVVSLSSWTNVFPSLFELIDRDTKMANNDKNLSPLKAIVYFNTTSLVEFAAQLGFRRRSEGLLATPVFVIHSRLSQRARTKAADRFRQSRSGILFSSDVTARGMDFPDVTHVIQVDTPRDRESYIHRLGRTARQNKSGQGWLFLPPSAVKMARSQLRGLPLVSNETLETSNVASDSLDSMEYHRQIKDHIRGMDEVVPKDAYLSIIGSSGNQAGVIEDLNSWATMGWGWREPPVVTSHFARKLGLSRYPLNIRDDVPTFKSRRDNKYDLDNRRDSRRGDNRRFGKERTDPFAEMGREVRDSFDNRKASRGRFSSSW